MVSLTIDRTHIGIRGEGQTGFSRRITSAHTHPCACPPPSLLTSLHPSMRMTVSRIVCGHTEHDRGGTSTRTIVCHVYHPRGVSMHSRCVLDAACVYSRVHSGAAVGRRILRYTVHTPFVLRIPDMHTRGNGTVGCGIIDYIVSHDSRGRASRSSHGDRDEVRSRKPANLASFRTFYGPRAESFLTRRLHTRIR